MVNNQATVKWYCGAKNLKNPNLPRLRGADVLLPQLPLALTTGQRSPDFTSLSGINICSLNLAGQLLVQGYYFSSPPMAAIIEQQPVLKQAVRLSLWPVVWWAHLALKAPYLAFVVLLGWL